MITSTKDPKTIAQIQRLLEETFFARDKLYAAATELRDPDQKMLCEWFADRLGGYAATFQQMVAAGGEKPVEPDSSYAAQAEISEVQTQLGNDGVLDAAKRTEERLADRYHQAQQNVDDRDTTGLLIQHRRELEIIDCVLRILTRAD